MLDCTAAVLLTFTVLTFERVLTGTGTSWPEAMMAFLLLLVKIVGRELILNLPVDSRTCTMAAKASPAATYILVPAPTFRMIRLKLIRLFGSRMLPPGEPLGRGMLG